MESGRVKKFGLRLIWLICRLSLISLLLGWTSDSTVVTRVWQSPYIGAQNLGKTLVLAYTLVPRPIVGGRVEQEWVMQLQDTGIDAHAWTALGGMMGVPSMGEIRPLLRERGFDTLLVTQLLALKRINPNIRNAQVAVVETRLYSAPSDEVYWSVQSDTFLYKYSGDELRHPNERDLRDFVEVMIRTMSGNGVL
ncbi:hypothetical protein BTJ40_07895 [Microbulbifer sp. A4B17]|uniref:hypothetical protein n=1 Tax=Microbulbifer sp. A4B17 TaxID=359370 RepID=UPI000D52EA6C|nr:hypothetical protein [Microbulbifer sp. A4B17]AWF80739.1 hypothetical protein BTJ40_07895 [Microbulbifer sp. A4B17]